MSICGSRCRPTPWHATSPKASSGAPGRRLQIVSGDPRTAALVALGAPSRPSVYLYATPERSPWVTADTIKSKGAIVVWPTTDTSGTPPAAIKERFPDLVPEVPRAFERSVQGRLPLVRIGWGLIRPQADDRRQTTEDESDRRRNPRVVVAFALAHLAAEHPIDEHHIAEDDRQQRHGRRPGGTLARGCGGGLPDGQRGRNEIGKCRDHQAEIAEQEQQDRSPGRRAARASPRSSARSSMRSAR